MDSAPFGLICVISDNLTSGIYSSLHTMGSHSTVSFIHTLPQTSTEVYINSIYAGYPSISSVHLVRSADASFSSGRIPSTDCLTEIYLAWFDHGDVITSTERTGANTAFNDGILIFVWHISPWPRKMFWNITVSCRSLPLGLTIFFHVYLLLILCTFLLRKKIHPSTSFFVSHRPSTFSNFNSDIGSGIPYLLTEGDKKTVCITRKSAHDRCSGWSSDFGSQMFMKSSTKSSRVFRKFVPYLFFHFFYLACVLFRFLELFVSTEVEVAGFPPGHHRWELLINYIVLTVVMVIYH